MDLVRNPCRTMMHGIAIRGRDLGNFFRTAARCLAAEALPEELQRWSGHQWISPPVEFVEGQDPPTALSWLRRRGPQMSQAIIFKLFREHKVRFYDGDKVRRIKRSRELNLGDRILLPLHVAEITPSPTSPLKKDLKLAGKDVSDKELDQWVETSRKWLLYSCNDFFVINKPEGIPVQGGKRIRISIDRIYERLAVLKDWNEQPKLVHRLDKMATGALVVARSSNAASWLCQSFNQNDQKATAKDFSVTKVYLAVLDARRMTRTRGTIQSYIRVSEGQVASQTHFELLSKKDGLALVKLRPKTGRKHQLRLHCAFKLNAPVLGDRLYSSTRQQRTENEFRAVGKKMGDDFLRHLYLHAHELTINRPGKQPIHVIADLPEHMSHVIQWIREPDRG